ncbi:hypothetical protein PHYBOEH_004755 [Phytophthora boehmeriae]|uniref:Helicase ATP-binding domain-containing protein n=1 Tax=Phytophthora boehmeriae TaxID=109152 RepID=A0A8T1X8R3_9STRA|nr:hypothetical protein PHYBOEH_004755 [Phytophthora boehmeriae]
MDAEDDGVRKRKAVAGASQRKKPRRNVRDKSEFVSVEVGMREFRKRLAGSGAAESTGKAISSEETESTQKVKTKPTTRAKSQTSARAAAKKTPPAKTATTKTTKTPTARKLTLAEVKLQLEQEQKQRVESRIQALYQQTCSAASAVAATAPQAAATLPSVINTATSASAPEPASSGVAIESFNYSANAQGPNVGIAKVLPSVQAAVVDNNFLNNEMDVVKQIQVATTTSPVVEPTLSQTTNEFISDDADEDLMFAMALEEVERKLTTPQKPPSSDVVVAVTAPSSLASHSYQNADMSPSPVKPSANTSELTDENISSKNMVATCPSPTMDGTIHCSVPNTNGSAISDAAVSGSDDDNGEEASYEEEGSSPKRTSTIDSGNYVKYKVQRDDDDDDAENDVFDGERNPREQLKEAVKPSLPLPVDPVKSIATSELGEIPTSCIPTNSTEVERKTAPSNTDDDGEDDEVITAKRNGRLGVIPLSDPESNSESDSEDNDSSESDDTPSANVLEAALKAAGVGEKNVRSNGGPGENDQICVLARAQDRDRGDATESFSVMTELCLSNQRSPNWRWSLQQVHNVTTSAREFQAIKSISFFSNDLKQVLQRGQLLPSSIGEQLPRKPKKINPAGSILSPRLRRHLQKHYNESQMQAILGCLGEESRVIIQGPPGTGKTKTVLGLLSALLDGAGLSTLQKAKGTARIRVGASLQNAKTASVSKTVAETKIRILVAAPSNAAVDELVVRLLSEGLFDGEKGESYRPRIVRVGRPENGQLSSLAAAREASESKKNRKKMRKYAREVEEVLLESLVMKHRNAFPTVKQTRQAIIKNAQIVFCTLSGAGSVAMCDFAQCFDALIIDEAGQAVETSTLIPLKFRPHRVVLVGDHRQLPATVMSKKLVSMGYDRSLLQRLVENGSPVLLLTKQYRMHPEIAEFPSTYFYDGRLVQDAKMREWTAQEYHRNPAFKPLLFLDVQGGTQSQVDGSTSLRNLSEVEVVIQLVRRLITTFPQTDWKKRVGVIAPYKQQIYEVRSALGKLESECDRQLGIEVNTVDGFQGREKEIIIYSCVRTSHGGRNRKKKRRRKQSNGSEDDDVLDAFWADERRMNVAITRAKSSLWIVGNSTLLKQSRAWRALIQHTKDRGRYIGDPTGTVLAD